MNFSIYDVQRIVEFSIKEDGNPVGIFQLIKIDKVFELAKFLVKLGFYTRALEINHNPDFPADDVITEKPLLRDDITYSKGTLNLHGYHFNGYLGSTYAGIAYDAVNKKIYIRDNLVTSRDEDTGIETHWVIEFYAE